MPVFTQKPGPVLAPQTTVEVGRSPSVPNVRPMIPNMPGQPVRTGVGTPSTFNRAAGIAGALTLFEFLWDAMTQANADAALDPATASETKTRNMNCAELVSGIIENWEKDFDFVGHIQKFTLSQAKKRRYMEHRASRRN
jgi:hypothetical protein